jgi:hypothetical protein
MVDNELVLEMTLYTDLDYNIVFFAKQQLFRVLEFCIWKATITLST